MDGTLNSKDTRTAAAAEVLVPAPKTDEGVDSIDQLSTAILPTPPIREGQGNEEGAPLSKENPFDQYYSQLTHQQNMLQDSVRVTAYQRAILENAADFKVRGKVSSSYVVVARSGCCLDEPSIGYRGMRVRRELPALAAKCCLLLII